MKLSDISTKVLGDKKRWWAYRARKKELPESYLVAIDGVERYLNMLGGITKGEEVANGIVTATKQNPLKVPIVIRLTGTNEEIAVRILKENGFSAMTDMDEAVQRAVKLATGGQAA